MTTGGLRDCVFLVADSNMQHVFQAFLTRDRFHLSLGCGPFLFEPKEDLFVHSGGCDPGQYERAHQVLAPFTRTHRHAVVALDTDWDGSPGAESIQDHICENLAAIWTAGRYCVIAIEPELEAWVLQDSPHLSAAFHYNHHVPLRQWFRDCGHWPDGAAKPPRPKEAIEALRRFTRIQRSGAVYGKVAAKVSAKQCVDPAFRRLATTLSTWFPRRQNEVR
jgi:hypothetical protein